MFILLNIVTVLLVSTDSASHVDRLSSSEIFLEELKEDTEPARKDNDANVTTGLNAQTASTSSSNLNKLNDNLPTLDDNLIKEFEEFLGPGMDEFLANEGGGRRFANGPMMNAAVQSRYQVQRRGPVQSLYQVMQEPVQSFYARAVPSEIPQDLRSLAIPDYLQNPDIPRKRRKHARKVVVSDMYQNPQYMLTSNSPDPQASAQMAMKEVDSKYLLDLYLTKLKEQILGTSQIEEQARRPMDVVTVGPPLNEFTLPTALPVTLSTMRVQPFPEFQAWMRDYEAARPSSGTSPQIIVSTTTTMQINSPKHVNRKIEKFLKFVKKNRDLLLQFIASKRQNLKQPQIMGLHKEGYPNEIAIQMGREAKRNKDFVGQIVSGRVPPLAQNLKIPVQAEYLNLNNAGLALNVRRRNQADDNLEALVGQLIATTPPNPLDEISVETNTRKLSAREIADENEARALLSSIVDRATSSAVLMRAHGSQAVTISPLQLDLAPAKGEAISKLRAKKRLCQRNVLYPEGPKYRANGKPYMVAYAGSKRDFASTNSPKVELPICCNCCLKSVLGCN